MIVFGRLTDSLTFSPFLYMFTDTENEENCSLVLNKFKEYISFDIEANFLMTDLSPVFYNSWCRVFKTKPQWIYCMWHMKKSVKRQLYSKVSDTEDRFK